MAVTPAEVRVVLQKYIEAWVLGDKALLLSIFAEDAAWCDERRCAGSHEGRRSVDADRLLGDAEGDLADRFQIERTHLQAVAAAEHDPAVLVPGYRADRQRLRISGRHGANYIGTHRALSISSGWSGPPSPDRTRPRGAAR